jgi:hypothetical protein
MFGKVELIPIMSIKHDSVAFWRFNNFFFAMPTDLSAIHLPIIHASEPSYFYLTLLYSLFVLEAKHTPITKASLLESALLVGWFSSWNASNILFNATEGLNGWLLKKIHKDLCCMLFLSMWYSVHMFNPSEYSVLLMLSDFLFNLQRRERNQNC